METIQRFAVEHKLRTRRDGSGDDFETVIDGRIYQSSISEYSATELCVAFVTDGHPGKAPRTGLFNTFKANCLAVGMTPRQIGDDEGVFSFNPCNPAQAKVAIKGIRAKVKRQISPETALAGAARLAAARAARQDGASL